MPTTPRSAVEAFRAEARPYSRASPSAPDAVAGCPYAIRVLTTTIRCIVVAPTKTKPRRQEVRATAVDDLIAQILLEALAPDQVKIAVAAVDQMTNEARQIEQQWSLRRERARYEAERARRLYTLISTTSGPTDGVHLTYSVQGAAAALGVTTQVIFDYLTKGLLTGRQIAKGQPWADRSYN
jgi:hypothetical protein